MRVVVLGLLGGNAFWLMLALEKQYSADFSTITEGMYLKRILQANDFVLSRGFTHSPVLLMNGRVLADPQVIFYDSSSLRPFCQ